MKKISLLVVTALFLSASTFGQSRWECDTLAQDMIGYNKCKTKEPWYISWLCDLSFLGVFSKTRTVKGKMGEIILGCKYTHNNQRISALDFAEVVVGSKTLREKLKRYIDSRNEEIVKARTADRLAQLSQDIERLQNEYNNFENEVIEQVQNEVIEQLQKEEL